MLSGLEPILEDSAVTLEPVELGKPKRAQTMEVLVLKHTSTLVRSVTLME